MMAECSTSANCRCVLRSRDRSTFAPEAIDAGFRIRHFWGDYAYSPFEPQRSPSMIWELSS